MFVAAAIGLVAIRESVVPRWTLSQSQSPFQTRTFGSANPLYPTADVFDGTSWRTMDLPGEPSVQLRYSEEISPPWTRWFPLVKFGHTTIKRHFSVISHGVTLLSGSSHTEVDQTVYGFASAQKYLELAKAKSTKNISEWARSEMRKKG